MGKSQHYQVQVPLSTAHEQSSATSLILTLVDIPINKTAGSFLAVGESAVLADSAAVAEEQVPAVAS